MFGRIGAVTLWLLRIAKFRPSRPTDFYRDLVKVLVGVVENRVDSKLASGEYTWPEKDEILSDIAATDQLVKELAEKIEYILRGNVDYDTLSPAIRRFGTGR